MRIHFVHLFNQSNLDQDAKPRSEYALHPGRFCHWHAGAIDTRNYGYGLRHHQCCHLRSTFNVVIICHHAPEINRYGLCNRLWYSSGADLTLAGYWCSWRRLDGLISAPYPRATNSEQWYLCHHRHECHDGCVFAGTARRPDRSIRNHYSPQHYLAEHVEHCRGPISQSSDLQTTPCV